MVESRGKIGFPDVPSLSPAKPFQVGTNNSIVLSSDMKTPVYGNNSNSDLIVLQSLNDFAKSVIAFRDKDGNDCGWLQAHNYLDEALTNQHKHMSMETPDSTGAPQTRIDIPYGSDTIELKFTSANVTVTSGTFTVNGNYLTTLNGNLSVAGSTSFTGNVTLSGSSSTTQFYCNRPDTGKNAEFGLGTANTESWALRLRNDSTEYVHLRDTVNGVDILKGIPGSGANCRLVLRCPNSATTDANLDARTMEWTVNESTHVLTVRIKYSDGTTLKSGTVSLS